MEAKSDVILKILMNRFHPGSDPILTNYLTKEEAERIKSIKIDSSNFEAGLNYPQTFIETIHYSWLQPILQTLPENLQPLALQALPKEKAVRVNRTLSLPSIQVSQPVKRFFLGYFYKTYGQAHLPLEYVPESPLKGLTTLTKNELILLIDYLGLYDLAEEMRYIVDKTRLQKLQKALTAKEYQFIKQCMHQKEKLSLSKIGLETWKGNVQNLRHMLHRRGLFRLGKALAQENRELVWHLSRTLDIGRGKLLELYSSKKVNEQVRRVLFNQIMNILNFLKLKRIT